MYIIIIGRTNAFTASNQKRQECRQHANRGATKLLNMSQQLTSQKCKVKVRRVHDESIAFLTGNIYCISLDRDCHGHIVFATTDSTLNLASIPYEIIHIIQTTDTSRSSLSSHSSWRSLANCAAKRFEAG